MHTASSPIVRIFHPSIDPPAGIHTKIAAGPAACCVNVRNSEVPSALAAEAVERPNSSEHPSSLSEPSDSAASCKPQRNHPALVEMLAGTEVLCTNEQGLPDENGDFISIGMLVQAPATINEWGDRYLEQWRPRFDALRKSFDTLRSELQTGEGAWKLSQRDSSWGFMRLIRSNAPMILDARILLLPVAGLTEKRLIKTLLVVQRLTRVPDSPFMSSLAAVISHRLIQCCQSRLPSICGQLLQAWQKRDAETLALGERLFSTLHGSS
jgi:hypothetical protein